MTASLLAHEEQFGLNSEGADIHSQNVLIFISIYEILMMRHCRRRGKVNLARVATSKRSLLWMVVAIAAACSVLRERAAFAAPFGSFARTLLQHSFSATIGMYWMLGVFLSLDGGVILCKISFQHQKS